ncbi:MAG: hypothetical protein WC236_15465 [Gallionellaceae bacterium]|jgi:hypothetical protein
MVKALKASVVVVDDDSMMREMLKLILCGQTAQCGNCSRPDSDMPQEQKVAVRKA